jgi:hypothetical protein
MPWWGWVLVWVGLFAFAIGVFTVLGFSLWHRAKALFTELGEASDRFALVSDQLQRLSQRAQDAPGPAVFESPSGLRQQRVLSRQRPRGSESRRQRLG